MTRSLISSVGFAAVAWIAASACGLPKTPDIRQQWSERVGQIGPLTVFYPPQEQVRLGQLYIADASTTGPNAAVNPRDVTNMLVSDDLVAPMDARRASVFAHRQAKSAGTLATDLASPSSAFYKQGADNNLQIAALPKYSLASVDQEALAGAAPTAAASFFGAFGLAQSKYVTVEAIGVEIADLPVEDFAQVVNQACNSGKGAFGDEATRAAVQRIAFNAMDAWWSQRQAEAGTHRITPMRPQLFLLQRVYYMRGIRYIFNDTNAASAVLGAALNSPVASGITSPTTPTSPAPSPVPQATGSPTTNSQSAELKAQMDALSQQIAALQGSLPANTTSMAGSFARATAQGVEMDELFERPIAFGYVAYAEDLSKHDTWQDGIAAFCADFRM